MIIVFVRFTARGVAKSSMRHSCFLLVCTSVVLTGVVLDRIFIFVVSDPSILPIWPLLIAL